MANICKYCYTFALFIFALVQLGCSSVIEHSSSASPEDASLSPVSAYAMVNQQGSQAAATVNPIATQAAMQAFAKGGNAVDAALAAAFTLGVVDSHNSGVGGGCFILARLADGTILAIDGREMAASAATRDMYIIDGEVNRALSKTGALAPGVPGSVAALFELQQMGGNLTFSDVLIPAADVAEHGFPVDATFVSRLQRTADAITGFPETARIYLGPNGEPRKVGDVLIQKDLANSYRQMAKHGPDWFYRGEFADKTAQWMSDHGGIISAQDFANYHTVQRQPVSSQYKGYTVYGFPPPSSGGVHVAQMLNILNHFPLETMTESARYHHVAEAMRLAFADRAHWLGDSDFVDVPKGLADQAYGQALAELIDPDRAADSVTHHVPPNVDTILFDRHTTHLATADKEGNWVAITTTLNTSYGSKVVIPGTGILLNNQMDDFSSKPGTPNAFKLVGAEANSIAPGKRPLSSMSPTIVMKDGQPMMTLGAAGGPTIISQVLQALVGRLALEQSIDQSLAAPRIHHQWRPNLVFVESRVPPELVKELESKGHTTKNMGSFGGTQAIVLQDGRLHAVTEPRIVERNEGQH